GDVEEKRSLRHIRKAVRPSQRILLGDAGDRERLAGESCQQQIVVWNVVFVDLRDVAGEDVVCAIVKVGRVGLAGVLVPLTGEDAAASKLFKRDADAADSGEKVNKGEPARLGGRIPQGQQTLADCVGDVRLGFRLACVPAAYSFRVNSQGQAHFPGAELHKSTVEQFVDVH